jgi:hypothetical protein
MKIDLLTFGITIHSHTTCGLPFYGLLNTVRIFLKLPTLEHHPRREILLASKSMLACVCLPFGEE